MPTPASWEYDFTRTRVWWSAKHKWTGMVHLAVSVRAGGKLTRCGIRLPKTSKNFKLYEWARYGNSPIAPTCSRCLELRKYDVEGQSAKFSGQFRGDTNGV